MDWLIILVISFIVILTIFYFLNGYFILYIINLILYPFANGPEYLPTNKKWCKKLKDNYKTIRDEYIEYTEHNNLKRFSDIDPNQKSTDIGDIPWEILMLRVYNKNTNKIKFFPKTYRLIKKIPGCSLCMFSVLPPGKKLKQHKGPSSSVYRYHLPLIVPKDNEKCFLIVNGKKHIWKEGESIIFDDTMLHSAENNTDESRLILFLDIKRSYNNVFLDWVNDKLLHYARFHNTVKTIVENTNNS